MYTVSGLKECILKIRIKENEFSLFHWGYENMSNKIYLYTYLQSKYNSRTVINHNGKEYEKECIYMHICISESLCCTPETNTLLINYTPI